MAPDDELSACTSQRHSGHRGRGRRALARSAAGKSWENGRQIWTILGKSWENMEKFSSKISGHQLRGWKILLTSSASGGFNGKNIYRWRIFHRCLGVLNLNREWVSGGVEFEQGMGVTMISVTTLFHLV